VLLSSLARNAALFFLVFYAVEHSHSFFYCSILELTIVLLVLGERALFLGMLHHLLIDEETLATPHTVHVDFGPIRGVGLLAEMHEFLLGCGQPEGININHLKERAQSEDRF